MQRQLMVYCRSHNLLALSSRRGVGQSYSCRNLGSEVRCPNDE